MAYTQTCCSVCVCGAGGRLFGVCAYGVYFLHVYSPPLYGCELGVWVGLACMYLSHTHTYTRRRVSLGNSRIKGKIFFVCDIFSFFFCGGVTHACLPFSFVRFLPRNLLSCCTRMYQPIPIQSVCVWVRVCMYICF